MSYLRADLMPPYVLAAWSDLLEAWADDVTAERSRLRFVDRAAYLQMLDWRDHYTRRYRSALKRAGHASRPLRVPLLLVDGMDRAAQIARVLRDRDAF